MLLVTALCWGLNWPVTKSMLTEWPPFLYRILGAAGGIILLATIARLRGEDLVPAPGQWGRLALASLLNLTSWMGLATLSLLWLDASEAAIIGYTMPIWAVMLAWPLLGERPNAFRVAGLAFGLSGVSVLLAGQLLSAPAALLVAKLPGVACILGTSVMFALGAVFTKRYPLRLPPVTNVAWQVLFGSLPLLLASLLFERWDFSRVTAIGWAGLGYNAVLALGVAYLAWFRALRLLPASSASIGTLLVPVIGVFSSALALGEPLGLRQLLALGLTVSGVALASRG